MCVLDDEHLRGAEELLGDDDRPESVAGAAAGVADDVGVAEGDAEGGGGVDAAVHAGYCFVLASIELETGVCWGRHGSLPIAYFLAGRWDRSPSSKHFAYFLFLRTRFSSLGVRTGGRGWVSGFGILGEVV